MKRPNRALFEKHIAAINENIEEHRNLYALETGLKDNFPGEESAVLVAHRSRTALLKQDREEARRNLHEIWEKLNELQVNIKSVKDEMARMESESLYYKDEKKLAAYLARLEKQYAIMQTRNVREEKALVMQINKAKRNQKQLTKWRKLGADKEDMVKTLNELKSLRDALYKTVADLKAQEVDSRKKERLCKTKMRETAEALKQLYQGKQRLIADYDNECQIYSDSRRKIKELNDPAASDGRAKSYVQRTPSGRPIAGNNNEEDDSDLDDGTYELFYAEKQLCRSLMAYVQKFLSDINFVTEASIGCDASGLRTEAILSSSTGNENSDDDNKPGFVTPCMSKALKKKHSTKRDKRRLTQSIPHAPHVFSDFERIGLKAPVNYGELPVVLEKLRTTLKYYEDQTLLPLNFSNSIHGSYATSESELTVDTDSYLFSVLSLSEAGDNFSQRNFSQCSLPFDKDFLLDSSGLENTHTLKRDNGIKEVAIAQSNSKIVKTVSLTELYGFNFKNHAMLWSQKGTSLESVLNSTKFKHQNLINDEGFYSKGSTR